MQTDVGLVDYGSVKTYIESGIWIGNLPDELAELSRTFAKAMLEMTVKPEHDGYFCVEIHYVEEEIDSKEVPTYGKCPVCGYEDVEFLMCYEPGSKVLCPNCREVLEWNEVAGLEGEL